jgi:hypothetical protein
MAIHYSLGTGKYYCTCLNPKAKPLKRFILVPKYDENHHVIELRCLECGSVYDITNRF